MYRPTIRIEGYDGENSLFHGLYATNLTRNHLIELQKFIDEFATNESPLIVKMFWGALNDVTKLVEEEDDISE